MEKNIKICIYGLSTYQLLTGLKQDFIGGVEVQQVLLGTELANMGFDVSFIVAGHGQEQHEVVNKINIYKALPFNYKINSLRSLYNAILVNWSVLNRCNADTYYCRGEGIFVGFVALFCLLNRKKFVIGMASDKDVDLKLNRKVLSCRYISLIIALKLAHSVISQNRKQQSLLNKYFKINSVLINNMHHVPTKNIIKKDGSKVLWVGTIKSDLKQPELFLKLATCLPEANFQMVGGPAYGRSKSDFEFYENIKKKAHEIPNLDFVGSVAYHEIDKYFENSSIFVNTSTIEGFPNTFIQAWMRYVPVVSLNVDPDEIICNYKLGFHSRTFDQMVNDVRILLNDEILRNQFGNNARKYSENEFNIKKIINEYIQIFKN